MEVAYSPKALEDILFWKKSGNKHVQVQIAVLIENIKLQPYKGIGKPEPLKHEFSGKWSRRIVKENRLINAINNQ